VTNVVIYGIKYYSNNNMLMTKIICTIGPSSDSVEVLTEMVKNGMDACRLNFSHGSRQEKEKTVKRIRQVAKNMRQHIAIIADLQGPKLRLGNFDGNIDLDIKQRIELSYEANPGQIPLQFDLSSYMREGERIFINDGLVELVVVGINEKTIIAETAAPGWIAANKGINIPDTDIKLDAITEKDREDALFALGLGVDYLAVSYVESAQDLNVAGEIIKNQGSGAGLIAKIEKAQAIDNMEDIIKASDAVMVARGDLAVETSPSHVPILQQKIINFSRQLQKPVIIATHMLESMTSYNKPTRAEASDVGNAVLSQVDALMLSAETAVGNYPVEAVKTMNEIIGYVEKNNEYKRQIKIDWKKVPSERILLSAIVSSAASLAIKLKSEVIGVATASGSTAILLSSFRPEMCIAAITHDDTTANKLNIVWGVEPQVLQPTKTSDELWEMITGILKKEKELKSDKVVVVGGSKLVGVSGATDSIKVVKL
jgi:pyruvate kinase